MFTIYCKSVGGRRIDRYFKKWENAKMALLKDASDAKRAEWKKEHTSDYFNSEKGFYVYQINGITKDGEIFTMSLIDGFFED